MMHDPRSDGFTKSSNASINVRTLGLLGLLDPKEISPCKDKLRRCAIVHRPRIVKEIVKRSNFCQSMEKNETILGLGGALNNPCHSGYWLRSYHPAMWGTWRYKQKNSGRFNYIGKVQIIDAWGSHSTSEIESRQLRAKRPLRPASAIDHSHAAYKVPPSLQDPQQELGKGLKHLKHNRQTIES